MNQETPNDNGGDVLLPRAHPFWPLPRLTLVTDATRHRSRGSGLVILKDKWLFVWREANIHNARDPNSTVNIAESRSGGQFIGNVRTLYRAADHDGIEWTDMRARLMAKGRVGIYGTRRDSRNGGNRKPFFACSDDNALTWKLVPLDHFTTTSASPGFTFNRFPASVGGHDSEGFILFWAGGDRHMHAAITTDNGETWEDRRLYDLRGRPGGEVSVVRLGKTNRWIMTCRDSRRENPVYKSTNLIDWEGPFPSGKWIGNNPGVTVYDRGFITWIAASRPYHYEAHAGRAIPVNGKIFKGLVTTTADADSVWKDPSSWPGWSVLLHLPVHFDGTFVRHMDHWLLLFGAVEGPMRIGRKYYSQLGIMSSMHAPLRPFQGFQPGWLSEPEAVPSGIGGGLLYETLVRQ